MDKCSTRRGIHKFEARYEEQLNQNILNFIKSCTEFDLTRGMLYSKIYVKDICINCGAEIKK